MIPAQNIRDLHYLIQLQRSSLKMYHLVLYDICESWYSPHHWVNFVSMTWIRGLSVGSSCQKLLHLCAEEYETVGIFLFGLFSITECRTNSAKSKFTVIAENGVFHTWMQIEMLSHDKLVYIIPFTKHFRGFNSYSRSFDMSVMRKFNDPFNYWVNSPSWARSWKQYVQWAALNSPNFLKSLKISVFKFISTLCSFQYLLI